MPDSASSIELIIMIFYDSSWRCQYMETYVKKIVDRMLCYKLIDEEMYEEYVYAMVCTCESIMVICSIFLLAVILDNVGATVCFLLCFFSLRKRTDGYHAKTFLGCFAMTILAYLIVVRWSEYTYVAIQLQCGLLLIASVMICMVGASIHPNMQMSEEEVAASKRSARVILLLENIIILLCMWVWKDLQTVAYMVSGVVLCCISLYLSKFMERRIKSHEK